MKIQRILETQANSLMHIDTVFVTQLTRLIMLKKVIILAGFNLITAGLFCSSLSASIPSGEACFKDPGICELATDKNQIKELAKYLYQEGVKENKGKAIQSGTFVIVDPGFKLLDKLIAYANPDLKSKGTCSEVYVTTKSAYPRKSTHFVEVYLYKNLAEKNVLGILTKKDCDVVHYGIDFAKGELPMADKQHLLFGKIGTIPAVKGKDLIFIKMEEAGLSGLDALKHTIDLIKTTTARLWPNIINSLKTKLGLKDSTLTALKAEVDGLENSVSPESTDSELIQTRKERIPAQFMAYYLAVAAEILGKNALYENMKKMAKAYGIQYMIGSMNELKGRKEADSPAKVKMITDFIDTITRRYPDYAMRFGNEVILSRPSK